MKLPTPLVTPVRFVLPRIILAVACLIVAVSTVHTILCWVGDSHYTPIMAARDQAALRAEIAVLRAHIDNLHPPMRTAP